MERLSRLVIAILIVFTIITISTFGWLLSSNTFMVKTKNNQLPQILESHVYKLAHEIGERSIFRLDKLSDAARYIEQVLTSFGYKVEFQAYTTSGVTAKNIIATKIGVEGQDEIIIVGAHYDTCFNPGADDNASGVAALLELARFMSDKKTRCSIKFIAFVNEEPPFFKSEDMGSRVYVRGARKRGEDIKAALIFESIGYYSDRLHSQRYPPFLGIFYPNRGNFITVVGNFSSRWLVKEVVLNLKNTIRFPVESFVGPGIVPGVDFSDNWSFWKEGYPAVMITDTALYRNPDYHLSSDTYEKLNYENMAELINGLSAVLIKLAGDRDRIE